jgi:hypothetical protein
VLARAIPPSRSLCLELNLRADQLGTDFGNSALLLSFYGPEGSLGIRCNEDDPPDFFYAAPSVLFALADGVSDYLLSRKLWEHASGSPEGRWVAGADDPHLVSDTGQLYQKVSQGGAPFPRGGGAWHRVCLKVEASTVALEVGQSEVLRCSLPPEVHLDQWNRVEVSVWDDAMVWIQSLRLQTD